MATKTRGPNNKIGTSRGRPPRADQRASCRVEIRLTVTERDAVARLAHANNLSMAETFRLGAVWLSALLDEDGTPPVILGETVLFAERPLAELLPGKKKPRYGNV